MQNKAPLPVWPPACGRTIIKSRPSASKVGLPLESSIYRGASIDRDRKVGRLMRPDHRGHGPGSSSTGRKNFSVGGTLIEAFASLKSFKPRDAVPDEPPAGTGRQDDMLPGESSMRSSCC